MSSGEAGTAMITDHAHVTTGRWWQRCMFCGLGMTAHTRTRMRPALAKTYRCPACVTGSDLNPLLRDTPCPHGRP
jgi:hypothetical protein